MGLGDGSAYHVESDHVLEADLAVFVGFDETFVDAFGR